MNFLFCCISVYALSNHVPVNNLSLYCYPCFRAALGFKPGRTISLPSYGPAMKMVRTGINCQGSSQLDTCEFTGGWGDVDCRPSEVAKVRCDQPGKEISR